MWKGLDTVQLFAKVLARDTEYVVGLETSIS